MPAAAVEPAFLAYACTMPSTDYAQTRAAQRSRNLLAQELRETAERARLGGFFYPVAVALTFLVAGAAPGRMWQAALATLVFLALAVLRVWCAAAACTTGGNPALVRRLVDRAAPHRGLGAFTSGLRHRPNPAAGGAAVSAASAWRFSHTLCMRLCLRAGHRRRHGPDPVLLWRQVAPGVA